MRQAGVFKSLSKWKFFSAAEFKLGNSGSQLYVGIIDAGCSPWPSQLYIFDLPDSFSQLIASVVYEKSSLEMRAFK
jgi:hypothetical protein